MKELLLIACGVFLGNALWNCVNRIIAHYEVKEWLKNRGEE